MSRQGGVINTPDDGGKMEIGLNSKFYQLSELNSEMSDHIKYIMNHLHEKRLQLLGNFEESEEVNFKESEKIKQGTSDDPGWISKELDKSSNMLSDVMVIKSILNTL